MTPAPESEYKAALLAYLADGNEGALLRAYDLGRRVLANGAGVLEIALLHHAALAEVIAGGDPPAQRRQTVAVAAKFLVESLSPFEMMLRGFREANVALRGLNERLEAEARRIAHALHDEAAQILAAVYISLDQAVAALDGPDRARFAEPRRLLNEVEAQLRRLSHELRPTILDDLGLTPALEFLAEGVAARTGLEIEVRGSTDGRLQPALETALYRCVQEALTNTARHAAAHRVRIDVERASGRLRCAIRDDGVGFDPASLAPSNGSLGLLGMKERLGAFGGSVALHSAPNAGTEVVLTAPAD